VDRIIKWSSAFKCAIGAAALLLPLSAAPESHIQAQTTNAAANGAVNAAAHVNFKIVIPQVLYLHVADADTVAVMSNSRNVALSATAGSPAGRVAGNFILSAAARRTIARDVACAAPTGAGGMAVATGRIICTASMP
jgi:hypothetical protein